MDSQAIKTYIIRKVNCEYNDEFIYQRNEGKVVEKFIDENKAKARKIQLERERYLEQFSYIGGYVNSYVPMEDYTAKETALKNYMSNHFGIQLGADIRFAEKPSRQPTTEEIDELRTIINFNFYTLQEFDDKISYYVPSLNPNVFEYADHQMSELKKYQMISFYATHQEALDAMVEVCDLFYFQVEGEIDEISTAPKILARIIKENDQLFYEQGKLKIGYKRELVKLINDLLVERPIIIEEQSLEYVEANY